MLAHSGRSILSFSKVSSPFTTTAKSSLLSFYCTVRNISSDTRRTVTTESEGPISPPTSSECPYTHKPPTFSDPILEGLKHKAQIRCALELHGKAIITREEYQAIALEATYGAMSLPEIAEYLTVLSAAGEVILYGDYVYLRPVDIVNEVFAEAGIQCPLNIEHPSDVAQYKILSERLNVNNELLQKAILKTAKQRQRFWASVTFVSGLQMTCFAYFTFLKYDWDVVEPITYFTTIGTALVFYLFFVVFKREHSFRAVDEVLVADKLKKETNVSVNLDKMLADMKEMDRISAKLQDRNKK